MSCYIQAASKKELNARIAADGAASVYVSRFDLSGEHVTTLDTLRDGEAVKLYTKRIGGSPYAKGYGQWKPAKGKVA